MAVQEVLCGGDPQGRQFVMDAVSQNLTKAAAYAIDTDNKFVAANAPQIDNVKVEWKQPGASDFASCYENDFAVCRRRTLSGSSMSFDYAATLASVP